MFPTCTYRVLNFFGIPLSLFYSSIKKNYQVIWVGRTDTITNSYIGGGGIGVKNAARFSESIWLSYN